MADLKTTAEERRRVTDAAFAREDMDHRACLAVLDDLDTLLAENARLRAVAEAARGVAAWTADTDHSTRGATLAMLRAARAALGEP